MDYPIQLYHSVTQLCNWNCPYCEFPTLKNPSTVDVNRFKELLLEVKQVTDNYDMEHCVEGGELGVAKPDVIDAFFTSNLADTYHVTTNGKFLEKNYHEKYKDKIHSILYHVKPEILDMKWDVDMYDMHGIETYYTIVITRENINLAGDFFDYHSDLNFIPHILQPRRRDLELMNIDYYKKVYDIVQRDNVNEGFERRYKFITENFDSGYIIEARNKVCCNDYVKMMIDYVTETLIRCCISTETDRVPLDLLYRALPNDKLVFPKWDDVCNKCIATFNFRDIYYVSYDDISVLNNPNIKNIMRKMS